MNLRIRRAKDTSRMPLWVRHPIAIPLGIAILLATLSLVFAQISQTRETDSATNTARRVIESNRDAAIRALVRQTDDYKRATASLAADATIIGSLRSEAPTNFKESLAKLTTLARIENSPVAFLSDVDGNILTTYPERKDLIGSNFSYRDWFKGVSRTNRPYVSDGYRTAAAGQPLVVAVASPVTDKHRTVGYVVLLLQLDLLQRTSTGALVDRAITVHVSDQSGQPLLEPLKVDNRGQPISQSTSPSTRSALAGRKVSATVDGRLTAAGPVPGIGWAVTAEQPASIIDTATADFRHQQRINLAVVVFVLLMLAAWVSILARRRAGELKMVISERRLLHASHQRFKRVFDGGLTGKILANADGEVLRINEALGTFLGLEESAVLGRSLPSFFADPYDRERVLAVMRDDTSELRGEMAMRGSTDAAIWGLVVITWIIEDDETRVLLVQVEDITARRDAEKRLTDLALIDELTGLPNRRLLLERFEQAFAVARSGRNGQSNVAALFIDLDGFKKINDRAGHEVGDRLLVSIATDLNQSLRESDTVARIGGDEFVVLVEVDEGLEQLQAVAGRIIQAVRREVTVDGVPLMVSASVGIAHADLAVEHDMDPNQLIRRADAAMYRAKERGRDRYDVFDANLRADTEARQVLENAMREGLRHGRIALVFQPVVDVDSNMVVGAEALLRLHDVNGRLLPTLPAIIAAEAAGLAKEVGARVMDLALAEAANWPSSMSVAVNISARELTDRGLRARVQAALKRYAIEPSRLVLEITETSILRAGPSALAELARLRSTGVRVAIDDFGTGYATLENLTRLPVDILKVDASFTAGLPDMRTHSAIVRGIASIAHALDIPCVIEGVETAQQLDAIRGMGVQAQGWLLAESRGAGHIPEVSSNSTVRPSQRGSGFGLGADFQS